MKKKKDNKKLNRFQWEDQLILLFWNTWLVFCFVSNAEDYQNCKQNLEWRENAKKRIMDNDTNVSDESPF